MNKNKKIQFGNIVEERIKTNLQELALDDLISYEELKAFEKWLEIFIAKRIQMRDLKTQKEFKERIKGNRNE